MPRYPDDYTREVGLLCETCGLEFHVPGFLVVENGEHGTEYHLEPEGSTYCPNDKLTLAPTGRTNNLIGNEAEYMILPTHDVSVVVP